MVHLLFLGYLWVLRRFVSETYEVLDTLFYDTGVTGGNTKWAYSNNFTINRTSDGTEISSTTNNDIYLVNKDMDSDLYDYDTSFAVEFDLIEIIGNGMVHIKSANSQDASATMSYCGFNSGSTCKIIVTPSKCEFYADGVKSRADRDFTITGKCRVGFQLRSDSKIKYQNFKVYPI